MKQFVVKKYSLQHVTPGILKGNCQCLKRICLLNQKNIYHNKISAILYQILFSFTQQPPLNASPYTSQQVYMILIVTVFIQINVNLHVK